MLSVTDDAHGRQSLSIISSKRGPGEIGQGRRRKKGRVGEAATVRSNLFFVENEQRVEDVLFFPTNTRALVPQSPFYVAADQG